MTALTETERPELKFDMFTTGTTSIRMVTPVVERLFGKDNYDVFRWAARHDSEISAETRLRVDREVQRRARNMIGISGRVGHWGITWYRAMEEANNTVNYARGVLFADQDRQATLTTNISVSDNRPSTVLEILTASTRSIGMQLKYEQGRQLGLALLCAEVMQRDENGNSRAALARINRFLENNFFIGKRGDPQTFHTYSYHDERTNRLMDLNDTFDPDYTGPFWVKALSYPVRTLRVRAPGGVELAIPALYEPREKDIASAVIKAKERSFLKGRKEPTNGLIETSPYGGDQIGIQFVVMRGGRRMRNLVMDNLVDLFRGVEEVRDIGDEDIEVDSDHGDEDRISFRRRPIFLNGLHNPIELIVFALEDWIPAEYEVGEFSEEMGMHSGRAHDLYKLQIVGHIRDYLWPFRVYKIPLADIQKESSFDYAARLRRKQRVYPSPFGEEI